MSAFSLSIQEFAEQTGKRCEDVLKETAVEFLRRVIFRSPVGNPTIWKQPGPKGYVGGRFRANWQVGIGNVGVTTNEIDAGGSRTLSKGITAIRTGVPHAPIWISNSLPYAVPLENGWSGQAPTGMVGVTVVEFQDIVKAALNSNK